VNFTREPIIETVITPRDGCKLLVRSSKGTAQEDYFVDAVEVVSFGHSFFFRSQERPKAFLVPVSDYEILETKEARMVLKNVSSDRSIKISGGRDAPPPRREESRPEIESPEPRDETLAESRPAPERTHDRSNGKRDNNRRRRGRRGRDRDRGPQEQRSDSHRPDIREQQREMHELQQREERALPPEDHLPPESHNDYPANGNNGSSGEEPQNKAPSFISKLFPPPPTLIKETLSRYKPSEDTPPDESMFEHPDNKEPEDDNEE
jgi:hypothetical protein